MFAIIQLRVKSDRKPHAGCFRYEKFYVVNIWLSKKGEKLTPRPYLRTNHFLERLTSNSTIIDRVRYWQFPDSSNKWISLKWSLEGPSTNLQVVEILIKFWVFRKAILFFFSSVKMKDMITTQCINFQLDQIFSILIWHLHLCGSIMVLPSKIRWSLVVRSWSKSFFGILNQKNCFLLKRICKGWSGKYGVYSNVFHANCKSVWSVNKWMLDLVSA